MAETEPELLKPGQIFAGRYRIERFLARGGHGAVFVAEQLATEATVAIKVLWPHVVASGDVAKRFGLEAKVAGRVKSEFIVRVLDAGVDDETGMPFLVMELLEGDSLGDYVKRHGPLSIVDSVAYLLQIAHGLDKAHAYADKRGRPQPIIHRDLKPDNVFLVMREDGQRMAKILDFGIAKALGDSGTMSQAIRGTPLYMACEQASSGPVTLGTDIWALGLIAFFMLSGKHYWRTASLGSFNLWSLFEEILHQPIIAPTERARELGVNPSWPAEFDTWFLRCVDRDPIARYPSAGVAASGLGEALLGAEWSATLPQSVMSLPPSIRSAPPRKRGWSRGRWWLVGSGALALGAFGYKALRFYSPGPVQDFRGIPSSPVEQRNGSAPSGVSTLPSATVPFGAIRSASVAPEPSTSASATSRRPGLREVRPVLPTKSSSTPDTSRPVASSPIYSER